MYCRVIACDFDGTGATDGHPAPELYAALAAARAQGIVTLLVTGRVLEDVQRACEDLSPFDGVVAENGAVIYLCELGRTIQIGEPPPERFLGELRVQGVPFHTGAVIVGTWEQHAGKLLELIRRFGIDGQMIFNRAALMLLPSGINKAVGVRRALNELGRSERNMVAFGDAENDIPMLIGAEVAVAARAAIPAVLSLADDAVSQPGGAGVARYIRRLIEQGWSFAKSPATICHLGQEPSRHGGDFAQLRHQSPNQRRSTLGKVMDRRSASGTTHRGRLSDLYHRSGRRLCANGRAQQSHHFWP
jgi:hydroxymethylpyrimidine pyrophosphatase-like HAD family hydrolase